MLYAFCMKVYLEYVLADNLFFDWLLLFVTAKLTKIKVKTFRIWLGACVGSIGAVGVSLLNGALWGIVAKLILFVSICCVAFATKNVKKWIASSAVFLFLTFVAGGTLIGVFYLFKIDFLAGATLSYVSQVPFGLICLGVLFFLGFLKGFVLEINKQKKLKKFGCRVSLTLFGKTLELQGIFDSGNSLVDGGKPVCFLCICPETKILKELLAQAVCVGRPPKNMHYVDFVTVDGKAQTVVFEADRFCIDGEPKESLLAFGNACGNGFDVLVNLFLTEGIV